MRPTKTLYYKICRRPSGYVAKLFFDLKQPALIETRGGFTASKAARLWALQRQEALQSLCQHPEQLLFSFSLSQDPLQLSVSLSGFEVGFDDQLNRYFDCLCLLDLLSGISFEEALLSAASELGAKYQTRHAHFNAGNFTTLHDRLTKRLQRFQEMYASEELSTCSQETTALIDLQALLAGFPKKSFVHLSYATPTGLEYFLAELSTPRKLSVFSKHLAEALRTTGGLFIISRSDSAATDTVAGFLLQSNTWRALSAAEAETCYCHAFADALQPGLRFVSTAQARPN